MPSTAEMLKEKERNSLDEKIHAFEEKYGTSVFLKCAISALNRIIADRKIASEREITNYFAREMDLQITAMEKESESS